MAGKNDGMTLPEGQKVVSPSKGAKENNGFEDVYNQTGDAGAAAMPKVEGDYCNTPKGQITKG